MIRYSLLSLNVTATFAAVLVWLWRGHGTSGLIFFVPLLLLAFVFTWLVHANRSRWAYYLLVAYFICWGLTAVCGPAAANHFVRSRINDSSLRYLDSDPMASPEFDFAKPPRPWCFIGNHSTPCPFVISLDYSLMGEDGFGAGETIYFTWVPGAIWIAHARVNWNACP